MQINKKRALLYLYYFIFPVLIICAVGIAFWKISPPTSVTILAGPKGGFFSTVAHDLKENLERYSISVSIEHIEETTTIIELINEKKNGNTKIGFLAQDISNSDYTQVYSLGSIAIEPLLVFSQKQKNISDIRDLKGLSVAIGPRGSGVRNLGQPLLNMYGINAQNTSFNEAQVIDAKSLLLENKVDAAFFLLPISNTTITELAKNYDISILDISEADALSHKLNYLTAVTIPKGTFSLNPVIPSVPTNTVAMPVAVVMNKGGGAGLGALISAILLEKYKKETFFTEHHELPNFFYDEITSLPAAEHLYSNGLPSLVEFLGLKAGLIITYASMPILYILAFMFALYGFIISYTEIIPVLIGVHELIRRKK